jgi:molybdate transport system substrate-binding protein
MRRFLPFLLTLMFAATLPARAEPPRTLNVFAAASLGEVLHDEAEVFTNRTGFGVAVAAESSATLAAQIDRGSPTDVFISADLKWMDWVAGRDLILKDTRRDIASNSLVLIAPANSPIKPFRLDKGAPLARLLGDGRLAVGDTAAVPAGIYGKQALQSLGLWDGVKDHLAQGENVRAALAFVARGEAPLGIVYSTDAKAEPKVKVVATFPESSHPPIVYPAAVTKSSKDPEAARQFLDFLSSPMGQTLLAARGFKPPPRR